MYPSFTHEELIVDWFKRSQGLRARKYTIFDQFISLWFAFNSWGTYLSKKGKDIDMLNWVKTNTKLPQILKELIEKDLEFAMKLQRLSQYEVLDMRPDHQGQSKSISDIRSVDQVLDVIYQIRCNLFHGQKSMIDPHDKELVELAFYVLSKMFKPVVTELQAKHTAE
jgi:hypothetical protein